MYGVWKVAGLVRTPRTAQPVSARRNASLRRELRGTGQPDSPVVLVAARPNKPTSLSSVIRREPGMQVHALAGRRAGRQCSDHDLVIWLS